MEAEIRVIGLSVSNFQNQKGLSVSNFQNLRERRGTVFPSGPSEGTNPADTLISNFYFLEL